MLNLNFSSALLNLSLSLPPMLSSILPITSDINGVFSDICIFANTQTCQKIIAGLIINNQSDVFTSDAAILQGPQIISVYCSDQTFNMNQINQNFLFSFGPDISDKVTIKYTDSISDITKSMDINGNFVWPQSDQNFAWIIPCHSDYPNTFTYFVMDPFLTLYTLHNNQTDIGEIHCLSPCNITISDKDQICRVQGFLNRLDQYFDGNFSDYRQHVSDKCQIVYTGPIMAGAVHIDLENNRLIFHDFNVGACSDLFVCL